MALSEPDRPGLDPKVHLQSSLNGLDMNHSTYESVLSPLYCPSRLPYKVLTDARSPALAEHNLDNLNNLTSDTTTSINKSAHQANSTANVHDFAHPTNGIHPPPSPHPDTQSSFDNKSSLPDTSDTAMTQASQPTPTKQSAHTLDRLSTDAHLDPESLGLAPPVVQQPLSDTREPVLPESERTGQDSVVEAIAGDYSSSAAINEVVIAGSTLSASSPNDVKPSEELSGQEPILSDNTRPDQIPTTEAEPAFDSKSAPSSGELGGLPGQPSALPGDSSFEADASTATIEKDSTAPLAIPATNQTQSGNISHEDQIMSDASLPTKSSRAREDDETEDAPAAKRTKTEQETERERFKVPDRPQIDTQAATQQESAQSTTSPMTKPRQKHFVKAISNIKRVQAARHFLAPVDYVGLNIPTYPEIIKSPMDLRTLEENLRAEKYSTVDALASDFNLIVQNCRKFNGEQHLVTQDAFKIRDNFEKNMASMPSEEVPEAATLKKKAPDPLATRAPPPRRESRSSLPGSARSPGSATSPQTFALGPEGIPIIRRDSTVDGRPKREIHRPAPKDLPYSNQKPKKKKYVWELKFCDHVLKELAKPKHQNEYSAFAAPVDPVALNIPTYLSVIKTPMDFQTIRQKLDQGAYESAKDFEGDVRLVFQNCYKFNPPSHFVFQFGKKLEAVFNDEWSKKRDWIDEHSPSSGQRSPDSSEDEESEDEEEEGDDGQMEIVSRLQKQIAEMSKQVELITSGAKKKTPPTASKKAPKPSKPAKKDTKKPPPAAAIQVIKKAAPKKQAQKERIPSVTYEQKQDISNRINSLSEAKMGQALQIIRNNMPSLQGMQDDELELDIDELSNDVLYQLLKFVRKHAPRPDDSPLPTTATSSSAAPARKKNKPMSKTEQEARIAQVQSGLSAFQKGAAEGSCKLPSRLSRAYSANHSLAMDVQQSIENQSDDDDEEDSESEEE